MKLDERSMFLILNFILVFLFIFVAYIVEGADKYDRRIILYIILLFLVLGTLFKINISKERLEQIMVFLKLKAKQRDDKDEIKEYVE